MAKNARLLIVDDERNIHYSFEKIFSPQYEILSASSAEDGIALLKRERPDVVVMDVQMPGMNGLEALQLMREADNKVPIVMMTAYGTVSTAIRAMKHGAHEYLLKPFDVERMRKVVEQAVETGEAMKRSVNYSVDRPQDDDEISDQIVGSSESMQNVYKLIGQVASQTVTVLLLGESGTGKELVARAIYHHSQRRDKPFLSLNCAALPETLLESELFGYEKGAFTGATERRIGKFEQVNDGTMFLDEIGELSLQTQAKILRVLQSGEFSRVGGGEVIKTDVRIIAATNRDLKDAIQKGEFREDLYYRLSVVPISLPSLRERPEDIPELVQYFLSRQAAEAGRKLSIDSRALDKLSRQSWPGNVRQLENAVRRAAVLAKGGIITAKDIDFESFEDSPVAVPSRTPNLDELLDLFIEQSGDEPLLPTLERMLMQKALDRCGGNQVRAARLLGINRNTLRNRMTRNQSPHR